MNELEIKDVRKKMGVSQERFAKVLGVTSRTIQNWESGGSIPNSKKEKIHEIIDQAQMYFGGEQNNVNGDNITGGNVTIHKTDTDRLLDLLENVEASLAKALEQNDKLLAIISNLTHK